MSEDDGGVVADYHEWVRFFHGHWHEANQPDGLCGLNEENFSVIRMSEDGGEVEAD